MRFPCGDPAALARTIAAVAGRSPEWRHEVLEMLQERIRTAHSVDHWADAVLAAAAR
jgi:hypothetical protein